MASFATLHALHGSLQRSHLPLKQTSTVAHHRKQACRAEFNIVKMMGGRGLCNGEKGLQQELEKQVDIDQPPLPPSSPPEETASSGKEELENSDGSEKLTTSVAVSKDAFEKEMMGLTGGFPGGEKGLIKFIEENPPHKPESLFTLSLSRKPNNGKHI